LVEDVAGDAELVQTELRRAGLEFCARCVATREALLRELTAFAPDLVISDYKLPHFNGTTALQLVNEVASDIPVIIVTAPINEKTAVECMRA
jgi:DNA-binding NtrC family response regulator